MPNCIIFLNFIFKKWAKCHYWIDNDQVSIVGPGSQLHSAVLEVKREVQHNDFTVAFEDGRRVPCDHARVLQQHFGLMDDGKVSIGTVDSDTASVSV